MPNGTNDTNDTMRLGNGCGLNPSPGPGPPMAQRWGPGAKAAIPTDSEGSGCNVAGALARVLAMLLAVNTGSAFGVPSHICYPVPLAGGCATNLLWGTSGTSCRQPCWPAHWACDRF